MRKYEEKNFNEEYERGYRAGRRSAIKEINEGIAKDDPSSMAVEIAKKNGFRNVRVADDSNIEFIGDVVAINFGVTKLEDSDDLAITSADVDINADADYSDSVRSLADDLRADARKIEKFLNLFEY